MRNNNRYVQNDTGVRKSFLEEVTAHTEFEVRMSQVRKARNGVSGRENNTFKGPEAQSSNLCLEMGSLVVRRQGWGWGAEVLEGKQEPGCGERHKLW